MTVFMLHGGQSGVDSPSNTAFFREMTKGAVQPIKILLIPFARTESEWNQRADRHIELLKRANNGLTLEITVAEEASLADQVSRASIVYILGGDTAKLITALRAVPNITELLKSKTLAGSSAGAYALVKYYWENDTSELGEGLGMLNVKAFAHFSPRSMSDYEALAQHKENLPIIALPEGEWVKIEV